VLSLLSIYIECILHIYLNVCLPGCQICTNSSPSSDTLILPIEEFMVTLSLFSLCLINFDVPEHNFNNI